MPAPLQLNPAAPGVADPETAELRWIGNATVLLRLGPFTVLTDPNFLHAGERAALGGGLRSKRLVEPACQLEDLPRIDLVVLSHHHGDHFDEVAARDLRRDMPIITTPHAAEKLRRQGFELAVALERWEGQLVTRGAARLLITAMPGRHGPGVLGRVLPPVMGSLLELSPYGGDVAHRLYITGDTIWCSDLRAIGERHSGIDTALVHLGKTRPLRLPVDLTMDAAQAAKVLESVAPRVAVPIHFDDYTVMTERDGDARLVAAAADLPVEVRRVARGDTVPLDARLR